jgi:hypothetical protein
MPVRNRIPFELRESDVRHPGTAKVQRLNVIQGAVISHGDEQQDVVLSVTAQPSGAHSPRLGKLLSIFTILSIERQRALSADGSVSQQTDTLRSCDV